MRTRATRAPGEREARAPQAPVPPAVADVLALQRGAGNQATARLLATRRLIQRDIKGERQFRDGTLSIFGTILDHAAPIAAPAPGTAAATLTDPQVSSISRVLSWNDPQADESHLGRRQDRNVELALLDPR